MNEHSRFVSDRPVTEETLLEKAVFGFFSHTEAYGVARESNQNLVEVFREDLVRVCNEIFKAIKLREYNSDRHAWIEAAESGDIIPEKFNGIAKQLRSERPHYTTRKAAKFCHNFAAICIVANDCLGAHFGKQYHSYRRIRTAASLSEGQAVSHAQMVTLGAISKELRSYGEQTNPNWPITYESNRPIIKTDKGRYFLTGPQARDASEAVTGRYVMYRRAFSEDGARYVRDYLRIRNHNAGMIFNWYVYNFDLKKTRIFNGVIYFLKGAVCWQGIDDEPYPRVRYAIASLREWTQHKEDSPDAPFISGDVLTAHLFSGETRSAARSFVLVAEKEGDLPHMEFEAKAKPLEEGEIPPDIEAKL